MSLATGQSVAVDLSAAPAIDVSTRRIAPLDGLRGLAALLVVFAHYFGEVPNGFRALTAGWLGVDVFFVLSGFLIGSVILANKGAPNFLVVFCARRACRIVPIYLVTVLSCFLFIGWFGLDRPWVDPPLPFLSYATFTQNIVMAWQDHARNSWLLPTWTVAVEEQFYLLAPLLLLWTPPRHLVKAAVCCMGAAVLFRAAIYLSADRNDILALVLLPSRWDLLFSGVLAAIIARGDWLKKAGRETVLRILPLVCVLTLLFVLLLDPRRESKWFEILAPLMIGIGSAAFILGIARGAPYGDALQAPILVFFGSISYGLYLIHQPVAGVLHGVILGQRPDIGTLAQAGVTVLALAASVALAAASWRMLESPFLRLGRSWRYGAITRRPQIASRPSP